MRRAVPLAVLLVTVAGCGGSAKPHSAPPAGPPRLTFADQGASLGYVERGLVERKGDVDVIDVGYTSGGKRLSAYLVRGPEKPNRPGIVLVHGAGGDRTELLPRALELAKLGAVVLAVTEPSSTYPSAQPTTMAQLLTEAKASQVADVVAARRAGDVLRLLPGVGRLGYLGWSAGAKTGAFVAASDPRFKRLALLSAGADTLSAFVAAAPVTQRAAVRRQLGSVDPLRYLAFARPGTLLLEDGTKDTVVPHAALENVIRAAPKGTAVRWYAAGHSLNDAAWRNAYRFLLDSLRG
jgi:dienelactone hydrolase